MATTPDSLSTDMGNSSNPSSGRIRAGDKVRIIFDGKIRTAKVVSHYDGTVTVRWHDVIIKRPYSQVVITS